MTEQWGKEVAGGDEAQIASLISRHEFLRTAVRVGFVDPIVRILRWTHDLWSARG